MAKRRRGNGQGTLYKRGGRGAWIVSWFDHEGTRQERSTRTTDLRTAERILAKLVADVALRREGVVDARQDRFAVENRKPLEQHVEDYLADCEWVGQAATNIVEKTRHLKWLLQETDAKRLSDLTTDLLSMNMGQMIDHGLSARSANFRRQVAVAFVNWCRKAGRVEDNPIAAVPKLDERKDRRRVRRPLRDHELARLWAVSGEHGRKAWYMAAALAGLRKGDLQKLRWRDIDFETGTITIDDGKAKRSDVIPIHPQLAVELRRRRDSAMALPGAKVFPETVTDRTRLRDFVRAGIAREEVVMGNDGKSVMVGKGRWRRPKMRIVTEDAEGRVVDLHAMRTTLGTNTWLWLVWRHNSLKGSCGTPTTERRYSITRCWG